MFDKHEQEPLPEALSGSPDRVAGNGEHASPPWWVQAAAPYIWAEKLVTPEYVENWLTTLSGDEATPSTFVGIAEDAKTALRLGLSPLANDPGTAVPPARLEDALRWVDEFVADVGGRRQIAARAALHFLTAAVLRTIDEAAGNEAFAALSSDEQYERLTDVIRGLLGEDPNDYLQVLSECLEAATYFVLHLAVSRFGASSGANDEARHLFVQRLVERLRELPPPSPRPPANGAARSLRLPARIPQSTFQEAKIATIALADGPTLRGWLPIEGEIAFRHVVKDSPLEAKLVGSPLLDWLGLPKTVESLESEITKAGLPAALLYQIVIGLSVRALAEGTVYVTAELDELGRRVGWVPRSRTERDEMRRKVWRWLSIYEHLQIIGRRDGTWRDPDTRAVIETDSRESLIHVWRRRDPAQLVFDNNNPPIEVTFSGGPLLARLKGDRRYLADFGNVLKLGEIPAGRPSGAWAQAIGLALQQKWRERGSYAEVARIGANLAK